MRAVRIILSISHIVKHTTKPQCTCPFRSPSNILILGVDELSTIFKKGFSYVNGFKTITNGIQTTVTSGITPQRQHYAQPLSVIVSKHIIIGTGITLAVANIRISPIKFPSVISGLLNVVWTECYQLYRAITKFQNRPIMPHRNHSLGYFIYLFL